ncbi:MAG: hypothetical protein RIQ56_1022, partial [Candidatus Parcubacteria bacterium]
MNVLSIGSDRKLFEKESAVRERQMQYASRFDRLDIIVFSLKTREEYIEENVGSVFLHPTNSTNLLFFGVDAFLKARKLPRPDVIT